ncbi:MAG: hypothetical protein QXP36_09225 [Conexivisphaerales archaeon]
MEEIVDLFNKQKYSEIRLKVQFLPIESKREGNLFALYAEIVSGVKDVEMYRSFIIDSIDFLKNDTRFFNKRRKLDFVCLAYSRDLVQPMRNKIIEFIRYIGLFTTSTISVFLEEFLNETEDVKSKLPLLKEVINTPEFENHYMADVLIHEIIRKLKNNNISFKVTKEGLIEIYD